MCPPNVPVKKLLHLLTSIRVILIPLIANLLLRYYSPISNWDNYQKWHERKQRSMIEVTGDCILKNETNGLRKKTDAAAASIPAGNKQFILPPKVANNRAKR